MDYEKKELAPINLPKEEPSTAAKKEARKQLKKRRQETQKFKAKYFELYDDVKINHREDW